MRIRVVVLIVLVAILAASLPASAGVSLIPTFLFSVRDGKVETHYLARFVGSQSGELFPAGNVLRPLPGENVTCQALQVHAGARLRDFSFQFARVATPQREDWIPFQPDDTYGNIGELGEFQASREGLATPLRFRMHVRKGESHEVRIFGIKEPITNGLMSLFGLSHSNLTEYSLLYVVPAKPTVGTAATTMVSGAQFADAEATSANFRQVAEAFEKVQGQMAKTIAQLNLNDATIARALEMETARNNDQEARLRAVEEWARQVAGMQVLVPPTLTQPTAPTPSTTAKCSWQLNLPAGVVTRIETLDDYRGERNYAGRWAGSIPFNGYRQDTLCLRLTWEGRGPDQWKLVRVYDGLTVNYAQLEVR